MNKQSLYVFGGVLMASTALATAAQAGSVKNLTNTTALPASTLTLYGVATQVFSTTTTSANARVLGGVSAAGTTAGSGFLFDLDAKLVTAFNFEVTITNASFTTTPIINAYTQSTSGTLGALRTLSGCSVQTFPERISLTNCVSSLGTQTIDALQLAGVGYNNAAALAVAAQKIFVGGILRDTSNSVVNEEIAEVAIVESKSAVDSAFLPAAAASIDINVTPTFSSLLNATLTAVLGSIRYSTTGALAANLTTVASASVVSSVATLRITSASLSDDAAVLVTVADGNGPSQTASVSGFSTGSVTFTLPGASIAGVHVSVTFDGTKAIDDAAAGSALVTPLTTTAYPRAVSSFTGATTSISKGGMSTMVNGVFGRAGQGSTLYQSFINITNTSSIDGAATIVVKREDTGATLGTFTTDNIKGGATLQVGSALIESKITTAAATGAKYTLLISGPFNGYVQNTMWNSVNGTFTDLSGFRNGTGTVDP